jgi:predicted MFS family arabinose efflux permease
MPRTGPVAVLSSPQAARILGASLIGRLPLGSAPLALLVFSRETMTLAAAGLLIGAYTIGVAVGGPILARAADRWRQPPVMWVAVTASSVGLLLVSTGPVLPLAIAAAALAGLGAPPFEAGLRVLWRHILPESLVRPAYTLDIAVQEMIFVVGPLVTLGAVAVGGPRSGLFAAGAAQLLGVVWFVSAPAVRGWRGVSATRHWAGPLRSPRLRVLLVAILFVGTGLGSFIVAVTAYAEAGRSGSWAGWLLAAQGVGALVGGLGWTRLTLPDNQRRLPWIAAVMAAGYLPLLLQPAPPVMLVLAAVCGLSLPPLLTDTFLSVDRTAPAGTAAEAFAWVATAFSVGSAAGSALTGSFVDATGSPTIGFAVAPLTILLAAVTFALAPPALALTRADAPT